MIVQKLARPNIDKITTKYFAHYKSERLSKLKQSFDLFEDTFLNNYEELSKNDWELHKKLIKEGVNPNEIAKIIRNDEIEKLQEISSQSNFYFDQTIEPSLYERCSFINEKNVTLIDYAAFFGSIKCFKYLLMNGGNLSNTGKYAIAGGNEEIIHLCEQNHSSFKDAYVTAIEFHRNDIFKYIYENKFEKHDKNYVDLGCICIKNGNYEILTFLEKEGMKVNQNIIDESARIGNLYLFKYFLQNEQIPIDTLFFSIESNNHELVKFIIDQEAIDINAYAIYSFYLRFTLIKQCFKIIFGNYLSYLKQHL